MTVRLIQSRSRLAAQRVPKVSGSGCLSARVLLDSCLVPCPVLVLPALCCAAFELPTKEKLLHCLQALTTYALQLVMHLTCTHSHRHTYTHIYIYVYTCKQLHTHSQLKRPLAAAAVAAAACLMSKLLPGLTRRMRNMPLPSSVGFMNSLALLAEGASNSLKGRLTRNFSLSLLQHMWLHATHAMATHIKVNRPSKLQVKLKAGCLVYCLQIFCRWRNVKISSLYP